MNAELASLRQLACQPRVRRVLLWTLVSLNRRYNPQFFGVPLSRPEIGWLGEQLAAAWLRRHGRRVLYHNYRGPHRGEVDIIARHSDVLTFVEVKTRTSTAFGRPGDAVTAEKQRLIQRGAQDWLRLLGYPKIKFRFDIAEVVLISGELPQPHIIENAFQLPDSSLAGR